jgi:hypothetical protein
VDSSCTTLSSGVCDERAWCPVNIGRFLAALAQPDSFVVSTLRLEYGILSFGLRLLDETVVARLPDQSPPRVLYQQLLCTLDSAAARHLHDHAAARRTAELQVGQRLDPDSDHRPEISEFEQALIRRRTAEVFARTRRSELFGDPQAAERTNDSPRPAIDITRRPRET